MTQSDPLRVSVAMTTYNGMRFIPEQIQSIVTQSYLPAEIIICDDASNDQTFDRLTEFQARFPQLIRLYRNRVNLGYVKNFEQAISRCTHNIIVLSDQDDVWFPHRLERIIAVFAMRPEYGMVFTDAVVTNHELVPLGYTVYARHRQPDWQADDVVSSLLRSIHVKGCTIAVRRDFCPYLFPVSPRYWGHDHWITFVMGVLSRIYMLDEPLMFYRRHGASAGQDALLDRRFRQVVRSMYRSLSVGSYHRAYVTWLDMLCHLEALRGMGQAHFGRSALEDGILKTQACVEFVQKRLILRQRGRLWRLVPAIGLLLAGNYAQFGHGGRTFVKDLIA